MTPFPTHSLFSVLFSLFSILVVGFSMFSRRILEILPGRFGFSSVFSVVGVLDSRWLDSRFSVGFSPVVWILVCRFSRFSLVVWILVWILVRILPGRLDSR